MDEQQNQTDTIAQPTEQPSEQPAEQPQQQQQQQPQAKPQQQERGMGWYKFLIYFALFAGALWNFIYGILYVTGKVYEIADARVTAKLVYLAYPGLDTVDIIFGIVCFLLAAYGIAVRFMLAKFKKFAPLCLYVLYGVVVVVQIIYVIVAANIIDASIGDVLDAQSIASLIVQLACLIVSVVYFRNRKDMFTN